MAELPEIIIFSRQMDAELKDKEFDSVDIVQEKILNMGPSEFAELIQGKKVLKCL